MWHLLTVIVWAVLGALLTPLVHRTIVALSARIKQDTAQDTQSERRFQITGIVLACLFGWLAWRNSLTWQTLVLSVYVVVFVVIASIDLDHRLILNRVVAPAAMFALLVAPTLPEMSLGKAVVGAATGFVLLLLPALIMPGGLGAGDVKLAGFLGMATGFPGVLTSLAVGIVLGGVATIVLLITRRIGRRDYIPYGPFLLIGALMVLMRW